MAKKTKRVLSLLLVLVLALGLLAPAWAAEAKKVTLTVLETSDLHGMIAPFDYASN